MSASAPPGENVDGAERIEAARDALLDDATNALLRRVRDVVCEPTRTQIVRALSRGPLTVNELASVIDRTKWATSQHLRILRDRRIVQTSRSGRQIYYRLGSDGAARSAVQLLDLVADAANPS